ncbi:hypothetical protein ABMA27_005381 [Loxostege sticticalis]|uniref:Regulatory protein zeste n=1 Tax=Loxostege sticticalis TaxID=481309 RepID=A0ABR3HJ87_LOXSC
MDLVTETLVNKMQLRMLVDYMSLHKNFANGEYSGPMGSNQQWVALKTQLKEYGPDKTVEQWCHTWRDLKKKVLPGFEVLVLHVDPGTSSQPSLDSLYRCSQTHAFVRLIVADFPTMTDRNEPPSGDIITFFKDKNKNNTKID